MIINSQTEVKNENTTNKPSTSLCKSLYKKVEVNEENIIIDSDRSKTVSIDSSSNTNQIIMIQQTFPVKIKEKPSLSLLDNEAFKHKKNKSVLFKSPLVETIKIDSFKVENLNNCYSDPFGDLPNTMTISKRNSFTSNKRRSFGKMKIMGKSNSQIRVYIEKMKVNQVYSWIRRMVSYVFTCFKCKYVL